SQGHVTLLGVACSLERIEPVFEAVEERLGREQLGAGGRELDREWQAVEPLAELRHAVRCGHVRAHRAGALAEELHRLVANERREIELGLSLDAERLAT